ncbi:HET-domain-containing protein [Lentinus brumalis]|uniref:HET-domain-containing protein n=1 Tax=Lentinus brumalis TaxID=2498619 RepID=A0A371DJ20_9APHY|nr:HET-domain-containing protein [Polyporus brumalis]
MRLLDTNTGRFRTIHDPRKERYAIISHTWAEEGEQTYKDILEIQQCAEQRYLGAIFHRKIHDMQEDPTAPCDQCHILPSIPLDAPSFPSDLLSDPLMPGLPGPLDLVRRKKAKPYDGVRSALPKGIRTLSSVARALATPLLLVIRRLVSFFTRDTVLVRHSLYAFIAQVATYVRLPFISSLVRGDVSGRGGGLHHSNIPGASPESDAVSSPELFAPTTPVHDHEYGSPSHVIEGRRADALRHVPILTDPRVSEKIRMACCLAAEIGMELVWMDSCCIDQDSSAELSEAINSMYEWYECSTICLVFLSDVDDDDDLSAPRSQFRKSRWHSRGWTLQELIAPRYHIFYSRDWKRLGTKMSLARTLAEVTGIDRVILNHEKSVDHVSVAQRMFWASRRATTRVEDQAYALMGIFGVHMPTIYGEGRKAFIRLQEEILRHTYDQTIFAWGPCWRHDEVPEIPTGLSHREGALLFETPFMDMYGLLANSPEDFVWSNGINPVDHETFIEQLHLNAELLPYPEYIISHDIRTRLPLLPADGHRDGLPQAYRKLLYYRLALLACRDRDGALIALPLIRSANVADYTNVVGATMEPDLAVYYHMFALSPAELNRLIADVSVHDVRIFRRAPTLRLDSMCATDTAPKTMRRFALQAVAPEVWSCAALTDQGFHITTLERRDTASYDILLTRAGKGELELIIVSAVFVRWPGSRSKWYSTFHHFEVAYKGHK